MKYLRTAFLLTLLLAFTSLLSFAAEQHKSINLDQKVTVGSQQLKPGNYTLKFDDSKQNTEVEFQSNGKTVARAPAQVVHKANPDNASFEVNTANGKDQLDRVHVSKNEELMFGNAAHASTATSQSTTPSVQ